MESYLHFPLLRSFKEFIGGNISYYLRRSPFSLPILHLDVTERCNARCRICNLWQKPQELSKSELTVSEIEAVVRDVKNIGCLVVSLGGGEPLIRKDIFDIIKVIKKYRIAAHMDTNGVLLNKDNVFLLDESGLDVISVSLDSHLPQVHNYIRGIDCFDYVINGMKAVKKEARRIKVIINCVLNKKNINSLLDIYKLALRLNVDGIKFPPIHKMAKQNDLDVSKIQDLFFTKEDVAVIRDRIEELIDFDRKYKLLANSYDYLRGVYKMYSERYIRQRCYAGFATCLIMPNGDVSPCYNFYNEGITAGNVRDKSFLEIYSSPLFNEIRKEVRKCRRVCWDLCTKEPSFHFDILFLVKNAGLIAREMNFFKL